VKKITAIMALIGIILTSFVGCTTTRYRVEISNVHNIRELNIRNAGATHWGMNLAGNRDNIDISGFSERVDIRVVDTNGIVHSRYNVAFDAAAFDVTRESYMGTGSYVLMGVGALGGLIALIALVSLLDLEDPDTAMTRVGGFRW